MRRLIPIPFFALLSAAALALLPTPANAEQDAAYERRELTIPVRDGTPLFAIALLPKGTRQPLPIMLIRTPFGAAGAFPSAELPAMYRELAEDGYIFVVEDVRGRFGSGGEFVVNRAQRRPAESSGHERVDRRL